MSLLIIELLLFLGASATVLDKDCDKLGVLLYEDLGCIPQHNNSSKCPTKYTCNGLERWEDGCYFRGQKYNLHERVPKEVSRLACEACECYEERGRNKFACVTPLCVGPKHPECHMKRSLEECCSTEEICPPFETCKVDDKEYQEGHKFFLEDTCMECVCLRGFKKYEEPFCRRISCGEQIWHTEETQNFCAPVYKGKSELLCCPNTWICHDGSEKVTGVATGEETCKFGEKLVKVGQKVEKNKITCECVIPPLLTCKDV